MRRNRAGRDRKKGVGQVDRKKESSVAGWKEGGRGRGMRRRRFG